MNPISETSGLDLEDITVRNGCASEKVPVRGQSAAPPLFWSRPQNYYQKTAGVGVEASSDLRSRLLQVTKDEPLLIWAALTAALNVCLFRYTSNTSIATGSSVIKSENDVQGTDDVRIMVIDLHGGMTFREVLLNVRQNLVGGRAKTYAPSTLLQEAPNQGASNRCPYFDVALVIDGVHREMPEVRHDITLNFRQTSGAASLHALFSPELYDSGTIERFCEHILQILKSGLENTNAVISELPILTLRERDELIAERNRTTAEFPRHRCVHELFEDQAARFPEHIALVSGNRRLTYREVNDYANQLAHYLLRIGVSNDAPVGIFLHRSIEQVIGVLGILKAGGAYVPYDPSYPKDRLAAMFEDLTPEAVVTSERLSNRIPTGIQRVCLDGDAELISHESTEKPRIHPKDRNLCYVIFTSGSTGRAKAAAVYHGGWINLLNWFVTEFPIAPADKTLVMSSISFDITQRAMAMPLISGAELHLLASDHYEPALILNTIEEQQITIVNCAPSTFYPLIEGPNTCSLYQQLGSLRYLFLGGEAISASRLKKWADAPECRARMVNVYGAAECSDVSSFYVLRDFERYIKTSVPIGKPIYNTQIYILDDNLQLVPTGVAGEICLAGDGVGKGYINDAALTARKFPNNPFAAESCHLLYRTGDVGRYLPDGNLEFVGRVDNQVKIRGQRVELGEIETILRQSSNVREAVVVQSQFTPDFQRLVAYVVAREPIAQSVHDQFIDDLRRTLASKLPQHMAPNAFVILSEMPLNPNGKIDRGALPVPGVVRGGTISEPPGTDIERSVAALFSKVLGREQISLNDNFFNLGGHSLLVTQVLAGIGDAFQMRFPAEEFYKEPTVAGVVRCLQQRNNGAQVQAV